MWHGHDQPLYLLSFDGRHSYGTDLFHPDAPLATDERAAVTDSKAVIYDGFREAVARGVLAGSAGILVDDEFGADILRDAVSRGYVTVLAIEKHDSAEFEFAHGSDFGRRIAAIKPSFARALVRFDADGDAEINRRQIARLEELAEYCRSAGQRFMVALRVPPAGARRAGADVVGGAGGMLMRKALTLQAIRRLQDAGVEPDVWQIQGLDRRKDLEHIIATVRRTGRADVGCIVLGDDSESDRVVRRLETAASVPGFDGFAVGRTMFRRAIAAYAAGQVTRQEAVSLVARRYREWVAVFEHARAPRARTA